MVPGNAKNDGGGRVSSQLRKGVLEYCVLALLRHEPKYGVELLSELSAVSVMATSQGTIYPLLSRLRREGFVDTELRESPSGPPRRYYALTALGRTSLAEFTGAWPHFRNAVDHFLDDPRHDPQNGPRPDPQNDARHDPQSGPRTDPQNDPQGDTA